MTNFTLADLVNTQGLDVWTMLGLRIDSGDVEMDCEDKSSYLEYHSRDIVGFNQHSDICSDCDHR